jgi:hypothetical protein
MTTAAIDAAARLSVVRERFYARMAVACLMVGLLGFAPTYWVPLAEGASRLTPLTHVHAALFFGWLLFSTSQAWLVASGRTPRHRDMGLIGISLATAMLFVGMALAIQRVLTLEAAGQGEAARRFAVIPVTGISFFALMVGLAIANVRRPQVHKRLMMVATISILQAAVGRAFLILAGVRTTRGDLPPLPPSVAVSVLPGLIADLLIVVAMVHDYRTTGRVHKVYWIGGAAVVAMQLVRVPLSATDAWLRFTYWLTAFAG